MGPSVRPAGLSERRRAQVLGRIVLEAVGAGKGLSDSLFELCEKSGVEVRYDATARSLELDRTGAVDGVHVRTPEGSLNIAGRSIVLACGGFEANPEMRARYLGAGWELAKVRGTRYNTGEGIDMALAAGAMSHGHWSGCHAVAWDLNAPPFGDRVIADLFQKHSYPFGIIVNVDGDRFVDEGADLRNYTYAKYGREVLFQPRRAAFQIFDQEDAAPASWTSTASRRCPRRRLTRSPSLRQARHRPVGPGEHRVGVQRVDERRRVRPRVPGRALHLGRDAAEVELGPGAGRAAVRGLRGDVRSHLHVRWPQDHKQRGGPGHA